MVEMSGLAYGGKVVHSKSVKMCNRTHVALSEPGKHLYGKCLRAACGMIFTIKLQRNLLHRSVCVFILNTLKGIYEIYNWPHRKASRIGY